VLAQVQAHSFFVIGDSQSHNRLHDGENNECANDRQYQGENNGNELNPKLARIDKEQTVIAGGVDGLRRK
jgi:hypothetical protein